MRLKAFTSEETDKLLEDIEFIATNAYTINKKAVIILELKHIQYLEHFKWTFFQWNPYTQSEFIKSLYTYNSYIIENIPDDGFSRSVFEEHFMSEYGKFYRGETFHFRLYQHQLEKYGVPLITDEELETIKIASILTSFMYNYEFRKTYTILVNYAHRPFEFDEKDIVWIELINRYKNIVEKHLCNIN